ncbi:aurora kinase A-B-like [Protopterus annectens]|uniref:aurora kinase A-B-like n=1 Tax=Protopterus annectens TaxID=7888 RepID=UPI001CFB3AA2|nr:aurora kinase A-B-like [Protopterus annectens]
MDKNVKSNQENIPGPCKKVLTPVLEGPKRVPVSQHYKTSSQAAEAGTSVNRTLCPSNGPQRILQSQSSQKPLPLGQKQLQPAQLQAKAQQSRSVTQNQPQPVSKPAVPKPVIEPQSQNTMLVHPLF